MTTIDLPEDLAAAHALIMVLHKSNHELTGEVASLEHRLDVMARRMFGRRSEQLDVAQLKLAFSALGGGEENEVVAQDVDVPDTPDPGEPATRTRQQRRTHGRKKLPTHLPREERVVEPETTSCPCCDRKMKCIGRERSEQLEYVPASYKVIETIRPKYACGHCKEGVYVALAPEAALARCKAGPGLLAKVVVSKYADHLPLYRQREIYEREGVELSERTLGGWIRQVATALAPIARAQWRSILGSKVLGPNATYASRP